MTSRPKGNIIPRSEVKMETRKVKSYNDFPEICILKDETLDILKTGKKITITNLAKYLKISYDAAEKRLSTLEKNGMCTSELMTIKDSTGRPNRSRVYYIKN